MGVPPVGGGPGAGSGAGVALVVRALPNPSHGGTKIELRRGAGEASGAAAPARVLLYSVSGRLVREVTAPAAAATSTQLTVAWDGRDASGRLVPAGLYLAQATWGEAQASARLVVMP